MKKALAGFLTLLISFSTFGQGTLIFKSLGIQKADGSGTYSVPLSENDSDFINAAGTIAFGDRFSTVPAGTLPGGVTVGLFTAGATSDAAPFAQGTLGTTATTGPFIVTPASQTVAVPNAPPGSTPTILIRAWQGSSYEEAQRTYLRNWREWQITTRPLGGDPGGGALPITPPTLTGWGPETGAGFELNMTIPEPAPISFCLVGAAALMLVGRRKAA